MGIFDFFKKQGATSPRNLLEVALEEYCMGGVENDHFYSVLRSAKVVILTYPGAVAHGHQVFSAGKDVSVMKFSDGIIPIFSSLSRIFDKGIIKDEVAYLEMSAMDLFNLAKGGSFILNPYSIYSKQLDPKKIEAMLLGKEQPNTHRELIVKSDTNVQIGQPAIYPEKIVESLIAFFSGEPYVKAAYLAWIYNPAENERAHLIIAIDLSGETQRIINHAGKIAHSLCARGELIDFMQISAAGGINNYFLKQTQPFYFAKLVEKKSSSQKP